MVGIIISITYRICKIVCQILSGYNQPGNSREIFIEIPVNDPGTFESESRAKSGQI